MKVRNFYPRSALRKLAAQLPDILTAGEKAALKFAMRKGRKYGFEVVVASSDLTSLKGMSQDQAAAVIANCNTKIFLKVA